MKTLWERMSHSLRVVLGMIVFAIIAYYGMLYHNIMEFYLFVSIPAGWHVVNRILDWIVPKWNTDLIIIWRLDVFILSKIVKGILVFVFKLIPSYFIGWLVAPYFIYRLGRDIIQMVKNRDVTPHKEVQEDL